MAIPSFVQASAGTVIQTGTATVSLSGCTIGNLIILQYYVDGVNIDTIHSTIVGVRNLNDTATTFEPLAASHQVGIAQSGVMNVWVGRASAATCSIDIQVGAGGGDVFARLYEFSGVAAGTTVATVFENSTATYGENASTGTTISDVDVVTMGSDRLALQFIFTDANTALAAFAGETGGDWAEPLAEFASATGTAGTIGLQTASKAAAGTVGGGTITVSSCGWGIISTALIPGAGITLDSALPDADVTTTGWTATPLFSKVNDASDATVIQATAS